jgi:hypothetical protein
VELRLWRSASRSFSSIAVQGALGTGTNHLFGVTDLPSVRCRAARSERICHMQQRSPETLQTSSCSTRHTNKSNVSPVAARCRTVGCQKACGCMKRRLASHPPHFDLTLFLVSLPSALSRLVEEDSTPGIEGLLRLRQCRQSAGVVPMSAVDGP